MLLAGQTILGGAGVPFTVGIDVGAVVELLRVTCTGSPREGVPLAERRKSW